MRVYLAAPFQEQAYMKLVREQLEKHGIEVTSRWLDVSYIDHNQLSLQDKQDWAMGDLDDVDKAQFLVIYNPKRWQGRGTGGRHVEVGYAIARSKIIIYIGDEKENLFHWHPYVKAHIEESLHQDQTLIDVLVKIREERRAKASDR